MLWDIFLLLHDFDWKVLQAIENLDSTFLKVYILKLYHFKVSILSLTLAFVIIRNKNG